MLTLSQVMLNKDKLFLNCVCKTCEKKQTIKISHYIPEIKIFIKKHGYKRSLGLDKPVNCYYCGTTTHYRSDIDIKQLFMQKQTEIFLKKPLTEKDLHNFFIKRRNDNDKL